MSVAQPLAAPALAGRTHANGGGAGWRIAAAIAVAAVLVMLSGVDQGADLVVPVLGACAAVVLLARGLHVAYLELTLWLWLISPGLRRLVDYGSVFHDQSKTLATPYVLALIGIPLAWRHRRSVHPTMACAFLVGFLAMAYATLVGVSRTSVAGVAASLLTWLPPLALGFFVLMVPDDLRQVRAMLLRVSTAGLVVLGTYGVVQWLVAPAWDTAWLEQIGDAGASFGKPEPRELRVWSMSNGPGTLAGYLVWLLVLQVGLRPAALDALRLYGIAAGTLALGLSSVRAAWVAGAAALLLVAYRGRVRLWRVVGGLVIGMALLSVVDDSIARVINDRLVTLVRGTEDESANARLSFQAEALPAAIQDPLGRGMGSTGAGVRASSGGGAFADTDSGYLETLRTFGSVAGISLLLITIGACLEAYARSRLTHDDLAVAFSAFLVTVPLSLLFGAAFGVAMWVGLGLLGRTGAAVRGP